MSSKLEKLITTALLVPLGDPSDPGCTWGLPLLLWGSPGIGKSERVRSAAKSALLTVKTVFAATRAPEDFSGVPILSGGTVKVECILGAVRELCELGRGVLFLDEIGSAVPSVQAALLSLVLDRMVGDTVLPPDVRILAAANPPNEAAGGWDLELPLSNRFAHLDVSPPTTKEWLNWLEGNVDDKGPDVEMLQEQVVANWPSAWERAKGIGAGFFRQFPSGEYLHKVPAVGDKARSRSWPSHRSWNMALRAVATCYALGLPLTIAYDLVSACVGEGAGTVFSTWLVEADLPHPHDVVTKGWDPDRKRVDKTVAVLSAMTGYVLAETDPIHKKRYAIGAWKVMAKLKNAGLLDLVVPHARRLKAGGLTTTGSTPSGDAVLDKELHDAAGLVLIDLGTSEMSQIAKQRL